MDRLSELKYISSTQHGFLARHSTCSNLLETLNDWTTSLDAKHDVCVAYFDFAKAFDRVSTPKLLHILSIIGVSGRLFFCIQ